MCLRHSIARRAGYFIDTDIIMAYDARTKPDLTRFIQCPNNRFYYTESVRHEYSNSSRFATQPDKYFTFIKSPMETSTRSMAPQFFIDSWKMRFAGEDISKKPHLSMTKRQLDDITTDLLILMEASCSQAEVDAVHSFLTNDMRVYRRLFRRQETKQVLESTINLLGLDHLIRVDLMAEALDKWEIEHDA